MKFRTAVAAAAFAMVSMVSMHGQTRPKITSVSHLAVYTTDATKTEYFYVHDLGATKGADPLNPAGVRYYFNPVQFVEVLPLPQGWTSVSRFDHAGFNTTDAEALRKYMGAHGYAVPAAVTKASDGSSYFEVKDPEENRVQFVQPPAKLPEVPVNPLSKHIIHVGYIIHNIDLENSFYDTLLGFRPYWHGGPTDDSHNWTSSQVPNGTDWIELMHVEGPEKTGLSPTTTAATAGSLDHLALGVPNMENAANMLYAQGRFTARHTGPNIGRDAKWQLNMFDPDGTRAELMEFGAIAKPCCSPFLLDHPKE